MDTHVCNACKVLVIDILSGSTKIGDRWRTIRSEHATLSHALDHFNGDTDQLRRSAETGCPLCNLIIAKVRGFKASNSASYYCIFVWEGVPETWAFQVAVEKVDLFVRTYSEQPPSKSLSLFGQPNRTSLLPVLESSTDPDVYDMPNLPYLPPHNLGSQEAFLKAREWLEECKEHTICSRPKKTLPKRVLDLGKCVEKTVAALYETDGEEEDYLAVSYTWGGGDRLVTTKRSDLKPFSADIGPPSPIYVIRKLTPDISAEKGYRCVSEWSPEEFPLDELPRVLQDAVRVAKALGFRYVWIDSLCILQSDKKDWAEQVAAMTDIYGRSTLTVSATSARRSDEPLLGHLWNGKISVGRWWNRSVTAKSVDVFVGDPLSILDLEEEAASSRGWIFQERLVSPATLHFTYDGMIWECAQSNRLDHDQSLSVTPWKSEWQALMKPLILDSPKTTSSAMPRDPPYQVWNNWTSAYSERDLYKDTDKFPAIAGVASTFAKAFKLDSDEYMAGLWKGNFPLCLAWRRYDATQTLHRFRGTYIAPSWSWGSVKGRLSFRKKASLRGTREKGPVLELLDWDLEEEYPGKFGRLLGGYIRVRGVLQEVTVDRQSHPYVRQKAHQECGISQGFVNTANVLCMLDEYVDAAPREQQCYCLRIGSFDVSGRESDLFLLLEREAHSVDEFRRIGLVETDAWWDRMAPTPNSGVVFARDLTTIIIK